MVKVYLASKSPRRLDILRQLGIEPIVVVSDVSEELGREEVDDHTLRLARMKAQAVADKISDKVSGAVILGADTEVSFGGVIYGQPPGEAQAKKMLEQLSGNTHEVTSSVYLIKLPERSISCATEKTMVTFRELDNNIIDHYVKTREPLDKAGGYGIQGMGALLVRKIDGCYFNVVGLPIYRLINCFKELHLNVWDLSHE